MALPNSATERWCSQRGCGARGQGGEANQALCPLASDRLGAPASQVRVVIGLKSRVKQVAVSGDRATLIARLKALSPRR
jgi:uncharacterized protein YggU (UPF0235/DUF167 family)